MPRQYDLLDTILAGIGTHPVVGINYGWAQGWIQAMKLEHHSGDSPAIIRPIFHSLSNESTSSPEVPHSEPVLLSCLKRSSFGLSLCVASRPRALRRAVSFFVYPELRSGG